MKSKQKSPISKNSIDTKTRSMLYVLVYTIITLYYQSTKDNILNSINAAIEYILDQPIGIKHNRMLRIVFGQSYKAMLDPAHCINILSSLKICCRFVFVIYRQVLKTLIEIFDLLNNRTYNSVMKRYDTVCLSPDQIVLAVFLFAIMLIIFMNLIVLYGFFTIIYLIILVLKLGTDIWEDFTAGYSFEYSMLKQHHVFKKQLLKNIITGDLEI